MNDPGDPAAPVDASEAGDNPLLTLDGNGLASATEFKDNYAVLQDLRFVRSCLERMHRGEMEAATSGAEPPESDPVHRALWTSALIAYARCFASGVRARLTTADVEALPLQGEVAAFHAQLLDMRSKHIAHSVNPFESVTVGVLATEDRREAVGVSVLHFTHVGFDVQGIEHFHRLVVELQERVTSRCQSLHEELVAEAKSLPPDDLGRLPSDFLVAPDPQAASRRR